MLSQIQVPAKKKKEKNQKCTILYTAEVSRLSEIPARHFYFMHTLVCLYMHKNTQKTADHHVLIIK